MSASKGNPAGSASESGRDGYCADNSRSLNNGHCGVCGEPISPRSGPGRPREYCSPACGEIGAAVRRIQAAIPGIENTRAVRSYMVAEVLNRLSVDREVLSRRARCQARDDGGRFA